MWRVEFSCRNPRIGATSMMIFSPSASAPLVNASLQETSRSRSGGAFWSAFAATTLGDQVIRQVEDALSATIGDRLVEKPVLIPFPREPTRREIAAFSVIVARCGVPRERLCRQAIDEIYHPDQGAGRKFGGPM